MKIKKKLRDLTPEEYNDWHKKTCLSAYKCKSCPLESVPCTIYSKNTWVNHKDLYSDKFLNQEIMIEDEKPDILDKQEKEYLRNVIKPFRNNIQYIIKQTGPIHFTTEYITIFINTTPNIDRVGQEYIVFPMFKKGTMYKNMEVEKQYTLEELGL